MAEDFLSQLAIPNTKLGIYLHLHNCAPMLVMTDSAQALRTFKVAEENPVLKRAFALPRTDYDAFQAFREQLRRLLITAQRKADLDECAVIANTSLWMVLHTPGHGPDLCRQARDGLKRAGQYIFTVACSARIAYVVSGGTVILSEAVITESLARADRSTESSVTHRLG